MGADTTEICSCDLRHRHAEWRRSTRSSQCHPGTQQYLTRDLNLNGIISGNVYAQPLKDEAAVRTLATMREAGERMPGVGHRLHTKDPRTVRLFELKREAGIDGAHM